jgi:hypothetical protein
MTIGNEDLPLFVLRLAVTFIIVYHLLDIFVERGNRK